MLTISAATAADCTQGCFTERLGQICWPCPIVLFGEACYLSRHPTEREETLGDPGDLGWEDSNVLGRRAWVLQEQILSRRSIIFLGNRLIWRCATLSTNEKYPLGIPHSPNTFADDNRLLHCIINGITLSMPKESAIHKYSCWYNTVGEFTSRNLTYKKDRLSAIAGIAKRFGVAVNDSYHAGLWRNDMILGLLWDARNAVTCTAKSTRAPSWSWASINEAVYYSAAGRSRAPYSSLVRNLDVSDPKTCDDHPFGAMSEASLSLSGIVLELMQDEQENSFLGLIDKGYRFAGGIKDLFLDVSDLGRRDQSPLVCLPVCICHDRYHSGLSDHGEFNRVSWQRSLEAGRVEAKGRHELYCLILQAVERNKGTYRRVGLCIVGYFKINEIARMSLFGEHRSITII